MKPMNLQYILMISAALITLVMITHYTVKARFELKTMVMISFMSLLSLVLAVFLSMTIPLFGFPSLRFGFSQLPIMLAGALFGPWWGLIAGVLEDLLELASGFITTPYIGFTLNKALLGLIPGLVFLLAKKNPQKLKFYIGGLVILLYGASISFILSTNSVSASQVTYVLDWSVKLILIGLTLLILPLTYLVYRTLKQKDLQKTTFQAWLLSVILIEIVINVILTPIWLKNMYGIPIEIQVVIRSIKASFFVVLNTFMAYFIYRNLQRIKK